MEPHTDHGMVKKSAVTYAQIKRRPNFCDKRAHATRTAAKLCCK